jgi:5-methylcytosine-specific restriction endonuclease McrA
VNTVDPKYRRYREANREKLRARSRASYAANPERRREASRRYRAANPTKVQAYRDANRAATRVYGLTYRDANRERRKENARLWRARNPEKVALYNRRRLARKAGVPSESWTTLEVLNRDDWHCQIDNCRCPAGRYIRGTGKDDPWAGVADHIQPLSRGGHDTLDNVQAAHRVCNSAKGAR